MSYPFESKPTPATARAAHAGGNAQPSTPQRLHQTISVANAATACGAEPYLLELRYVPPETLHANPQDPRVHPAAQLRQLKKSILTCGFLNPIHH